jgi:NADH:ubiquinone oxidoreductase subunit 5 (subunit L)/multisubunit Na+/H+ antiporter MnhA subunit
MKKSNKVILGIITVLPIIFMALYFIFFIQMFFSAVQQPYSTEDNNFGPETALKNMIPLFIMLIVMALTALGLLIYYIMHVVNNKNLESNERLIWILVFVFAGMVGFPIYWYMRIWKNDIHHVPSTI